MKLREMAEENWVARELLQLEARLVHSHDVVAARLWVSRILDRECNTGDEDDDDTEPRWTDAFSQYNGYGR